MRSKLMVIVAVLIVAGSGASYWVRFARPVSAPVSSTSTNAPTITEKPSFNKTAYSTTDPASIWVVINKQHPLVPASYVPKDLVYPKIPQRVPGTESMLLRKDAADAAEQMFAAASKDSISLMLSSGYRSYTYQVNLYASYVHKSGQAEADKISARPGHSEHQTGLAFDVEPASKNCEIIQCFADTPEGRWVKDQSYKYGFIIRYTPDKVAITGYSSEPWHLRYVGTELATEMHNQNIKTLEEFFGITGGDVY